MHSSGFFEIECHKAGVYKYQRGSDTIPRAATIPRASSLLGRSSLRFHHTRQAPDPSFLRQQSNDRSPGNKFHQQSLTLPSPSQALAHIHRHTRTNCPPFLLFHPLSHQTDTEGGLSLLCTSTDSLCVQGFAFS